MIQIVADTTCGIPLDQLLAKGIHVLPQIITFGDASYRDDIEIDTDTFLEKLIAAKQLPGTAAPPPALYGPIYKSILDAGDIALVITPQKRSAAHTAAHWLPLKNSRASEFMSLIPEQLPAVLDRWFSKPSSGLSKAWISRHSKAACA